jgi:hypothetical protein
VQRDNATEPQVGWRLLPDGTRRSEKMPWVQVQSMALTHQAPGWLADALGWLAQTEIGFQELFGPAGAQGKDSQASNRDSSLPQSWFSPW